MLEELTWTGRGKPPILSCAPHLKFHLHSVAAETHHAGCAAVELQAERWRLQIGALGFILELIMGHLGRCRGYLKRTNLGGLNMVQSLACRLSGNPEQRLVDPRISGTGTGAGVGIFRLPCSYPWPQHHLWGALEVWNQHHLTETVEALSEKPPVGNNFPSSRGWKTGES